MEKFELQSFMGNFINKKHKTTQMKYNVGIDIEKISRFEARNKKFLDKIFTKKELKHSKNKNSIAGIFCAKEAVIKACSPFEKLNFDSIEIMHTKSGAPYAKLISKRIKNSNIKISISHSDDYATAFAIVIIP